MTSTNKNSIPDTQCLKIKYIFICSMKKQMMFYSSKLRKTEKQRKSAFPNLGRTKNGRKRPSQHWENWKTAKNDFPNIGKIKKQRKMAFPNLGKSKNATGCIFPPLGKPKMQKIIRRSWAKCRKCEKQRFACKRRAKNGKSRASGHPERLKFGKTMFRDAPTSCFLWKWTVGESRSLKILKNKLSGSPEARKIWKTGFRGVPKHIYYLNCRLMEIRTIQKDRRVHQNFTFWHIQSPTFIRGKRVNRTAIVA